jgi:hypothetical protein
MPKQLATSTQKEKINQHKPPIAAIAIATIIVYPLWRSRRIHNHRNWGNPQQPTRKPRNQGFSLKCPLHLS